jgi:prolipoprotein diacylglyceryltransferase
MALWYASRNMQSVSLWQLADLFTVPAALGFALVRLGNGINNEIFTGAGVWVAISKNLLIATVCYWLLKLPARAVPAGYPTACFLVLYSALRFSTEYMRIQDTPPHLGLFWAQWLTIPLFLAGVWLWRKQSAKEPAAQ